MFSEMQVMNSGGGGSCLYAEGTVDLGTTVSHTKITTTDVNTGVAFKPKSIIYNTKTTGKTYYAHVLYDEDDIQGAGENKYLWWGIDTATTLSRQTIGSNTDGRAFLDSVDNDGFTVNGGASNYGNMLTYKAWG